jgi:Helix-turn-helix domain
MDELLSKLALTISQAVSLGGPCRSALYQDIKSGRLRAVKRGRSTRILMEDFKNYLASMPTVRSSDSLHAVNAQTDSGAKMEDPSTSLPRRRASAAKRDAPFEASDDS